jgi:hypothetical protein
MMKDNRERFSELEASVGLIQRRHMDKQAPALKPKSKKVKIKHFKV